MSLSLSSGSCCIIDLMLNERWLLSEAANHKHDMKCVWCWYLEAAFNSVSRADYFNLHVSVGCNVLSESPGERARAFWWTFAHLLVRFEYGFRVVHALYCFPLTLNDARNFTDIHVNNLSFQLCVYVTSLFNQSALLKEKARSLNTVLFTYCFWRRGAAFPQRTWAFSNIFLDKQRYLVEILWHFWAMIIDILDSLLKNWDVNSY